MFEIIRKIYSNSEMSEQVLVTKCVLTRSWRFPMSNELEQLKLKLEKNFGSRNMQKKLEKVRILPSNCLGL